MVWDATKLAARWCCPSGTIELTLCVRVPACFPGLSFEFLACGTSGFVQIFLLDCLARAQLGRCICPLSDAVDQWQFVILCTQCCVSLFTRCKHDTATPASHGSLLSLSPSLDCHCYADIAAWILFYNCKAQLATS
jgi:hypothetical protein